MDQSRWAIWKTLRQNGDTRPSDCQLNKKKSEDYHHRRLCWQTLQQKASYQKIWIVATLIAHLKIKRNSLKTSASSWSSSTSLIIAFKLKWFCGAPSFSIMYWNLIRSNILIQDQWKFTIITLSSVKPIFCDCWQQYSLNFFSRSLISFLFNNYKQIRKTQVT